MVASIFYFCVFVIMMEQALSGRTSTGRRAISTLTSNSNEVISRERKKQATTLAADHARVRSSITKQEDPDVVAEQMKVNATVASGTLNTTENAIFASHLQKVYYARYVFFLAILCDFLS